MRIAALIVAAGQGTRAGGGGAIASQPPKQYQRIGGLPVLTHTLRAFSLHPDINLIQVVISAADRPLYGAAVAAISEPPGAAVEPGMLLEPVTGGATRQMSVSAGLQALTAIEGDNSIDAVLIHDAARPFVDDDVIGRVVAGLRSDPAVVAAMPLADTLKNVDSTNRVSGTVDRTGLWRAQTPQGFHFGLICSAHEQAATAGRTDFTDDSALVEWVGHRVKVVEGSRQNEKLTTREDLVMADRMVGGAGAYEYRNGTGFDVHRFKAGNHVTLGGIRVDHDASLDGHSDADVVLHAVTDALLGAIAEGDIGTHFPPTDPAWKDAASDRFLVDAVERIAARGGQIVSVDLTVICEAPKIGPHREAMRESISGLLGIANDRVSVKATTSEGLGFTGRREGIAALANATVRLPERDLA